LKTIKRMTVSVIAFAAISVSTSGIASATHSFVGGGEWMWGITGAPGAGTVYSNYQHGSACHGATAVGTRTVRVNRDAGQWANASAPRANGNNQSYWRNDC
jgi:lactococcin 972 family bacteriocin